MVEEFICLLKTGRSESVFSFLVAQLKQVSQEPKRVPVKQAVEAPK